MITQTTKLGGRLIKWVLKKKDGRTYERGCNIHNTITKACINNLLEFNGPGSTIPNNFNDYSGVNYWVTGSGVNNRYGVFNFCALGNGTGTTSVDDTALKNQVGTYTTTKWNGYCGTSSVRASNIVKLRIAHIHTITDDFTIKEIGWFNRIYPDGAYSLSARVQLDEFVDLEAGDTFYTIYEVVMQETIPHEVTLPILGKAVALEKVANDNNTPNIPSINTNGYGTTGARPILYPAYSLGNGGIWGYYAYAANYGTSNQQYDDLTININWAQTYGWRAIEYSVSDYIQDSFYRDAELTFAALDTSIYALVLNGCILRLGEYDENNNFVPNPYYMDKALKFTVRQRISTDLLTPAA